MAAIGEPRIGAERDAAHAHDAFRQEQPARRRSPHFLVVSRPAPRFGRAASTAGERSPESAESAADSSLPRSRLLRLDVSLFLKNDSRRDRTLNKKS
jgi:hypothetical protein